MAAMLVFVLVSLVFVLILVLEGWVLVHVGLVLVNITGEWDSQLNSHNNGNGNPTGMGHK